MPPGATPRGARPQQTAHHLPRPARQHSTTQIKVQDPGWAFVARNPRRPPGAWIQGTGPAAKPNASVQASIRNVAHAAVVGRRRLDFDGEDALGQV